MVPLKGISTPTPVMGTDSRRVQQPSPRKALPLTLPPSWGYDDETGSNWTHMDLREDRGDQERSREGPGVQGVGSGSRRWGGMGGGWGGALVRTKKSQI